MVRDDTVLLLLTVSKSKLMGGDTVKRHSPVTDRVRVELNQSLLLLQVEEADSGLYFFYCSGVFGSTNRVGPGVSLQVGGKRTEAAAS